MYVKSLIFALAGIQLIAVQQAYVGVQAQFGYPNQQSIHGQANTNGNPPHLFDQFHNRFMGAKFPVDSNDQANGRYSHQPQPTQQQPKFFDGKNVNVNDQAQVEVSYPNYNQQDKPVISTLPVQAPQQEPQGNPQDKTIYEATQQNQAQQVNNPVTQSSTQVQTKDLNPHVQARSAINVAPKEITLQVNGNAALNGPSNLPAETKSKDIAFQNQHISPQSNGQSEGGISVTTKLDVQKPIKEIAQKTNEIAQEVDKLAEKGKNLFEQVFAEKEQHANNIRNAVVNVLHGLTNGRAKGNVGYNPQGNGYNQPNVGLNIYKQYGQYGDVPFKARAKDFIDNTGRFIDNSAEQFFDTLHKFTNDFRQGVHQNIQEGTKLAVDVIDTLLTLFPNSQQLNYGFGVNANGYYDKPDLDRPAVDNLYGNNGLEANFYANHNAGPPSTYNAQQLLASQYQQPQNNDQPIPLTQRFPQAQQAQNDYLPQPSQPMPSEFPPQGAQYPQFQNQPAGNQYYYN